MTRVLYTEKERRRREVLSKFAASVKNKAVDIARAQAERMKREAALQEIQRKKYQEAYRKAYEKERINQVKVMARKKARHDRKGWYEF